ncbi:hypothetical protein [Streptomyces sp. NPDC001502]|uniref:hypothetical protein n=1 Tax=Streptomyces sp. NPDC001502 TaxID=3364578 RepID=UPI0036A87999
MIDDNAMKAGGPPKWVPYAGLTGLGIVPLLVGVGLLLGPVANATASTRAYDAATPCAREQARDCLSEASATVVRIPEEGSLRHADIEVRTADGAVRRIHLADGVYTAPVRAGDPVRLVSWQGGIRDVAYGGADTGRAADSVRTGANPHIAHQEPLGAALFLIPFGVGALCLAALLAWFSSRSRRAAPEWIATPFVGLTLVAVFGGATGAMSASAAEALRPTALAGGLTLLAATVFCLVQAVRGRRDLAETP